MPARLRRHHRESLAKADHEGRLRERIRFLCRAQLLIRASACQPWQPDRHLIPAQKRHSYTTRAEYVMQS